MTSTEIAAATNIMLGTTQAQAMYIGSTLLWQVQQQQQELPAGYTRLAYISSTKTGGQYIDLGINLWETVGDTISADMKWMMLGRGSDNVEYPAIFRCRDMSSNSDSNGFAFQTKKSSSQLQCAYTGRSTGDTFPNDIYWESMYDSAGTYFDIGTVSAAASSTTSTSLFCAFDGSNQPMRFCYGYIFYMKIKKNGTLVRDLVPAKNSNNVAGLYDFVTNTFYTSAGTDPFVGVEYAGLPSGYTELYSISSTNDGSQYIDLNIRLYESAPNFDFKIKLKLIGNGGDNSSQATIFNTAYEVSPYPGVFIRKNNNSVRTRLGNGSNSDFWTIGATPDKICELDYDESLGYNDKGMTFSTSATLFCGTDSSGNPQRYAYGTIYYFKLWQNGALVRNMVPCISPNNVVGMYDTVNDVFYTTPSVAAFVAGPSI